MYPKKPVNAPLKHIPITGFPDGSEIKNPPANAGDSSSILGLESFPGKGNGNPVQYSCLGNPKDRGAWRATVHEVTKSKRQLKQLSMHLQFQGL